MSTVDKKSPARRSERKKQPRVIIFTTPTCGFCNAAKSYFRKQRIRFQTVPLPVPAPLRCFVASPPSVIYLRDGDTRLEPGRLVNPGPTNDHARQFIQTA